MSLFGKLNVRLGTLRKAPSGDFSPGSIASMTGARTALRSGRTIRRSGVRPYPLCIRSSMRACASGPSNKASKTATAAASRPITGELDALDASYEGRPGGGDAQAVRIPRLLRLDRFQQS